jgi:puromycin-sensitive aminopeptidase
VTSSEAEQADHRLPRGATPRRYELLLRPDLAAATFTGEIKVELDFEETLAELVCNAYELEIGSASLDGTPAGVRLDAETQRAFFSLDREFEPGRHVLEMSFAGILNDQLAGFYRSTFRDEAGNEHVIATTQMQSTDARRAFPCWDEPDRKAVFSITLDVPDGLVAVSNWPEAESEDLGDGLRRVRFEDTIPISTYIVAFVVGPLEISGPRMVGDIPIRVLHTPGKGALTDFAFEVTAHSVRFFEDWFGIPYPGAKLDLIGIPDFAAGAMENLGAVTFREAELLVDTENAAHAELERIGEVIEHEIAHMWFGDLVTMRWWNGIWLNEAFATFMSLACQDDFRPEWRVWDSFAKLRNLAHEVDALHSTRPIEYPVHRPEDAEGMYDLLTYEKGASVLRMIETYVGPERFRDGVRRYLSRHMYGNTETTDLWDAIEEAVGDEPIRALMDSWILQGGYPLVTVEAGDDGAGSDAGDRSGTAITVSQQPFALLTDSEHSSGSGLGREWLVPLTIAHRSAAASGEPDSADAMVRRIIDGSDPVTLDLPGARGDLVIGNVAGNGFYRVRYDQALFTKLLGALDRLTALERYCLVSDVWACALSGAGTLEEFLLLAGALENETDASVWTVVAGAMNQLDHAVSDADRGVLETFCISLLRPQLERIGWEPVDGEDPQSANLRSTLITTLAFIGRDEEVIGACKQRLADSISGAKPLVPGTARSVLAVSTHFGDEKTFEVMVDGYRRATTPQDEQRRLRALAAVPTAELASRVHEMCLTEIRSQDAPYVLAQMMFNTALTRTTWEFITSRWDDILARFPRNSLSRMMRGVVNLDIVEEDGSAPLAEEAARFVAAHPLEGQQKLVDQSIEILDVNVAFIRRERHRLGQLLRKL